MAAALGGRDWPREWAGVSQLESMLLLHIRASGLPEPEREYRFAPGRQFRADFAWPEHRLLAEADGGTWQRMGHSTGKGIARDIEKSNIANLLGWTYLRFTSDMVEDGTAIRTLEHALQQKGGARPRR